VGKSGEDRNSQILASVSIMEIGNIRNLDPGKRRNRK